MTEWQPIETAPRDGTTILTWGCLHDDDVGETPSVQMSHFETFGWYSAELGTHKPTHWMPLPTPPLTSASDACIYPDCLIKTKFGPACEHSCPEEKGRAALNTTQGSET